MNSCEGQTVTQNFIGRYGPVTFRLRLLTDPSQLHRRQLDSLYGGLRQLHLMAMDVSANTVGAGKFEQ